MKDAEPLIGYLLESRWQTRLMGVRMQEVVGVVKEDESLLLDHVLRGEQCMLQSLIEDDLGNMYDEDAIRFRCRMDNPRIVFPVSIVQMEPLEEARWTVWWRNLGERFRKWCQRLHRQ